MKKGFLVGLIVGILLANVTFVFANSQIQALLNDQIKVTLDGQVQELRDETTNEIQYPITYNDRTYLPLRTVANLVGVDVDYDSETNTAKLVTSKNENSNVNQASQVLGGKKILLQSEEYRLEDNSFIYMNMVVFDDQTAYAWIINNREIYDKYNQFKTANDLIKFMSENKNIKNIDLSELIGKVNTIDDVTRIFRGEDILGMDATILFEESDNEIDFEEIIKNIEKLEGSVNLQGGATTLSAWTSDGKKVVLDYEENLDGENETEIAQKILDEIH